MKRKKTEETPKSKDFWPVPGVDGEPYPPLVQDALDRVAKETLRRKRAECSHKNRKFITGTGQDRYGSRIRYRRACRDCHLVVDCEHPENAQHRERVKHIGDGSFLEYWECRCGKMLAKPVGPRVRTPNFGFDYTRQDPPRQTGTAWLKTEEQERQEIRTDRMVSRQIRRAAERGISDPDSPAAVLPLMVSLDHDPGRKPGAVEGAVLKALDRDLQALQRDMDQQRRYSEGAMAQNTESYILRKANGEVVLSVTEPDRASDLSWVRTMNGRTKL